MKISKIIFISYFSAIGLFLLSLMVMGFAFKNKSLHKQNNIETKTLDLTQFNHISIGEGCKLSIQNSQEAKFSYISSKDTVLIKPVYKIKNDTLFMISTKNNMQYNGVVLYSSNISSVSGKNCSINLREMNQEFLQLNASGTSINIHKQTNIKKYDITLKQSSKLHCWNNFKGDELTIDVENSKLYIKAQHKLSTIKGQATKHSDIQLPPAKSYQLDVDENSKLRIY